MSSFWWTLVGVLLVAGVSEVKSQNTAFPTIPNHLLECYMDDGIYHRANRMPSSFESFLDLVRRVEESRTSRNLNARELAMALLQYLKLDGIQSNGAHTKYFPSNILPFAPSGDEYFKHRLTLVGLIPRIDQSYMTIFNESLSKKEMCNLHFMLSSSIDPYRRDDERCSPLFEETRRATHNEPRSEWDPYQNVPNYYRRHKRSIDHREEIHRADKMRSSGKSLENEKNDQERLLRKRTLNDLESESGKDFRWKRHSEDKSSGDKKADVEVIPPQHPKAPVGGSTNEKDKFTIGDQELLSANEYKPKAGMQSLTQMGHFGRGGGRPFSRVGYNSEDSVFSGVIPGIPLSDCPVVNGVITTPYGSLTIGTVIAGIAAGLNPEEIPPVKLSVDPSELESPSDRVKNVWAATLAGTVADAISSSALLDSENLQIMKGGWNDSVIPKWYLLQNNQFKHMTEVGIRGSLDGLLLGINAKEWTSKCPNFKLSEMLETYYENLMGSVGAKYRAELRPKYAPDEILKKQVHLMALVLKKQKTNVLTILDYSHISREAVAKVVQHIQNMDSNEKSYLGSFMSTKIDNAVNMIAVIDSSWGHENLFSIFQVLRNAKVASSKESNLTIVCGNDGRVLMSSRNSGDLYSRFTREALLDNCTRGMNMPLVFDSLNVLYRKIYMDEKTSQKMNIDAQVAVLFPFDTVLQNDAEYVIEKSRNFRSNFPDVRLMIASNGRSDGFLQMVKDPKDFFPLIPGSTEPFLKTVRDLSDGVKQSYQRITRPSCGSYFDDQSAGQETRVTWDVIPGSIAYYRLLPQYFYTVQGEATITIRSKMRKPLTVCHSREMERPVGPSPRGSPGSNFPVDPPFPPEASPYGRLGEEDGPVQCKTITSEQYKITLSNPCQGASNLQECLPLYLSLTPPPQDTYVPDCPNCRLPVNIQYEISASGLTCYNSAAAIYVSPLLFSLIFIIFQIK